MFATLDDLDGTTELLVFGRALAAHEEVLALDSVVLVRGKVDHKDASSTCVILQEASRLQPTEAEIEQAREQARAIPAGPPPVRLRLDATALPASIVEDLKALISLHPGESDVVLDLQHLARPAQAQARAGIPRRGDERRAARRAGPPARRRDARRRCRLRRPVRPLSRRAPALCARAASPRRA